MKWLRFPRVIGVVVAVYLVAVTVLFGRLSMENHTFFSSAESTQGTVTALVPRTFSGAQRPPTTHRDRGVPLAPEIRYAVGGVTYAYTPSHGRYKPNVKIGDQVTIIYDPDDPEQTARIKGEGRVVIPVITGGFALISLLVVVGLVLTRRVGTRPGESNRTALRAGEHPPDARAHHRHDPDTRSVAPASAPTPAPTSAPTSVPSSVPSSAATPVRLPERPTHPDRRAERPTGGR